MRKIILMMLLMSIATTINAVLPPKYLSVPEWKSCVGTMKKDTATFVCLPEQQPENCPDTSWQVLKKLHEMEDCV